jgi:hypothetical protein
MLKSEIKPGARYAFREKRTPGVPFQRLKILEHMATNGRPNRSSQMQAWSITSNWGS